MRTKSTQPQFSSHLQSLIHRTLCFQFSYFLLIILVSVVFILRKIYKRMKKRSIMFLGIMRSKIDGRVKRWLMNGTVQVLLCLTMSLCVGIHLQMKAKSTKTMEDWLLNTCEECAKILQDQFPLTVSHVHSLALLMSTFHHNKTYSSIDQANHHLILGEIVFCSNPIFFITIYISTCPFPERFCRLHKKNSISEAIVKLGSLCPTTVSC